MARHRLTGTPIGDTEAEAAGSGRFSAEGAEADRPPTCDDQGQRDSTKREVLLSLLHQRQEAASALLQIYLRAFAFYLAVMAFVFKAAIDTEVATTRYFVSGLGLGACIVAVVGAVFGKRLREDVRRGISEIQALLGVDAPVDQLTGIRYTVNTAMVFNALVAAGWLAMFLLFR